MLPTHSRYAYSNITTRPDYSWPTGKRLAVYVALNIEQFSYGAGKGAAIAPPDQANSHSIFSWRDYGALVQLNGDIFLFYNKSLGDLNVEKFTHKHPRSVDGVNDVWHAYPHSSRNIHDIAAMLILQLNWYRPAVGAQAPGS